MATDAVIHEEQRPTQLNNGGHVRVPPVIVGPAPRTLFEILVGRQRACTLFQRATVVPARARARAICPHHCYIRLLAAGYCQPLPGTSLHSLHVSSQTTTNPSLTAHSQLQLIPT